MIRTTLLTASVFIAGCGSNEQPPQKLEITINGVPVSPREEVPPNPEEAQKELDAWSAKWFNEDGTFKNKAVSNLLMAESEVRNNIGENHKGTPASDKALQIADKLESAIQKAQTEREFPTLQSVVE